MIKTGKSGDLMVYTFMQKSLCVNEDDEYMFNSRRGTLWCALLNLFTKLELDLFLG